MIKYGSQHIDRIYSKFFEPNLYFNSWLVPEISYTSKHYSGSGGAIYVHRINSLAPIAPNVPGRDFDLTKLASDSLEQILLNNNFQCSRKLYDVHINAVGAALAEENLAAATAEVREGREQSALAALISEGTRSANTSAVTADNVKEVILSERQALSEAKGNANVLLVSPSVYTALLSIAGKEFTPVQNDRIQMDGRVGNWYGFTVFECNGLTSGNDALYYDHENKLVTVSSDTMNKVGFIMYYSEAFSVVDNLSRYKLQDGGVTFNGVAAQVEVNTGFRVTNKVLARVHMTA